MQRAQRWEFARRVIAWAFAPDDDPQLSRAVRDFFEKTAEYTPPTREQIRACEVLGLSRPRTLAEANRLLEERRA